MQELQLTRDPTDHRLFALAPLGSLRLVAQKKGGGVVEAAGASWTVKKLHWTKNDFRATDATGADVAVYAARENVLRHGDRSLVLERTGRGPFVLLEDGRELVRFEARLLGGKPLAVTVTDEERARRDPLPILLAAYAVYLRMLTTGGRYT